MMEPYIKKFKVLSCDVDMNMRLRLSSLFTMLQEAAIAHTEQLGAGRAKTLDRGFLWIVSLQHVFIKRMPVYDEELTLISRPGKTMHVLFPRFYDIADSSGEIIIQGSALWSLMDRAERSIIFPEENDIFIPSDYPPEKVALPRPIKTPEEDRTAAFRVPYSMTDINGHLSNVKYFDVALDSLDPAVLSRPVTYAAAEYTGEVRMGESFDIGISETDGEAYFIGKKTDGKRVFRLKLEFGKE